MRLIENLLHCINSIQQETFTKTEILKIIKMHEEKRIEPIETDAFKLDTDKFSVTDKSSNVTHKLARKEFELLYYIAKNKGKMIDRQTILDQVWGTDVFVTERTIDVHVRKIRRIFPNAIETKKGFGYCLKED